MSSRKVCIPALVLALFLGTLSSLHAQPPGIQGHRGNNETSIQREISSRMLFQGIMEFLRLMVAPDSSPGQQPGNGSGPGPQETEREGAGLCPNGRPRGLHPGNGNH